MYTNCKTFLVGWATIPRAFFPFVSPRGYEKRKIATWLILPVAYACLKD